MTHLEKAEHALETLANTRSNSVQYAEGLLLRAKVEALVSIAESLDALAGCVSSGTILVREPV